MRALPHDIKTIGWATSELGIAPSTAYRLAESGQLPGAFKVEHQWRISVPKFRREIYGDELEREAS